MVDIALAWSLTYLLHSTILSLLALAIAARLQHPSRRTTVLRAGLFGAVATSTIAVALPGGDPALAWTPPAVATIADPAAAARGGPLGIEGGVGGAALAAEPGAPLDPLTLTLVLALLGSFAGAGAVVVRRRRWIESLQREPVPDGTDRALLVDLVGRRDVLLTRSSALEGPVALSDREVCVPSNAWQALPPAERRSLLAHEAAHLVRRDPSMLLAGHLLQHAAFFQPLHRLVRARAQVAAELAADVWAVDRTDDALGYARALHGFAARLSGPRGTPAFIPGALASRPPLTERVALALDGSARGPGRRERWGTGGAIGALLLGLACAGPRVDAADQARGAGDAPGRHALPGTMAGDELVVAIDGESGATLYEDAGARAVGTFQLTDRFGRAGLQEALKEASGPPQITSASPRYGGLALSDRTLRIRAGEDVLFRDVQYVMEQCGVQSLCLWDLELEVPGGGAKYSYALPGVTQLEQRDDGRRSFDLRVDAGPTRYVLSESPFRGFPPLEIEVEEGAESEPPASEPSPLETGDRDALVQALADGMDRAPGSSVTLDPRKGTTYGEVLALLDDVLGTGARDVTFTGTFER